MMIQFGTNSDNDSIPEMGIMMMDNLTVEHISIFLLKERERGRKRERDGAS